MLDFLRPLKNDKFDFLTFLDGDKENSIQIQGQDYANPGEKIDGMSPEMYSNGSGNMASK